MPAAIAVAAAGSSAGAAPVTVEPAFGYQIGDRIVALGRVTIDERARLDAESLPKIGRLHGWLSLEAVNVEPEPGGMRIIRVFQVTASAPEPKMLFLPKVELKFKLDGRDLAEQLESVPVSVAPLATAEPILRSGFGALRPDRDAPDPHPDEALRRAGLLAAVLGVLALLWLALRMFALRRRGYAPFALAARRLRGLARRAPRQGAQEDVLGQAFRIMHEAFNDAAGQAVFSSQRERFLAEHPQFAGEADGVRTFFDRSDALFFGGRTGGTELAWLVELARRLARRERPGR